MLLRVVAVESQDFTTDGPADSDRDDERLNRLDKAISALPSRYKEPLLLTAMQGLSHDEAAQFLKISSKAVEMRLYRARQQLRETLENSER